ncbi:CxxH/CxxC protein [Edaphobacillus lindanitolerans]|uniref:CxxH/CxxC protein, BA_5709 family n=1 Tax=Edaphobacillus lindanitolerans TaxID=550447 RepID=A0A1U7PR62_9BACI|nr:CxxH/CxxC protein [Edaphobacillus lindanitolerans]SIT87113.1 CxxH/CxxC protein, BA_5709 family [Edaphobacillus lindanitolerans]
MENIRINSCETHIYRALDEVTAKTESFPDMEKIHTEEELSTTCAYCTQPAIYVVSNR